MNFNSIVRFGSKTLLKLRKYAPAIMTGAGIALGGACVVTACVQTTKLNDTLKENKDRISELREITAQNAPETLSEGERASLVRKEYISMAGKTAKLYAVPALLGGMSVACTVGGHHVLSKENAALASAYIALDKSFKAYKAKLPLSTTVKEERNDDGELVKETPVTDIMSPEEYCDTISPYARVFDCANVNWGIRGSGDGRLLFLRQQQAYLNDKLHRDGYLFLSDVYEALGFEKTRASQCVGWIDGSENGGDNYVDFGVFFKGNPTLEKFRRNETDHLVLDFNVDGPILNMFDKY